MRSEHPIQPNHRRGALPLLAGLVMATLAGCASQPVRGTPASAPPATSTAPVTDSRALPLPQGSQNYDFSWDGQLEGKATRSLSCQQNTCSLRTEASVPGLATFREGSRFTWQDGRARFEDYQRDLQLLLFPQSVRIVRQDGLVVSSRKGKTRSYPDREDLIDSLSFEAQLRADLVRGGMPRASYVLAEVKGPLEVALEEMPREQLQVAGREVATRVFRRRSPDGSRETTLWLDPAQAFLPMQVIHKDGAETYRLIWTGPTSDR